VIAKGQNIRMRRLGGDSGLRLEVDLVRCGDGRRRIPALAELGETLGEQLFVCNITAAGAPR
jgi:hypothetical protein